MQVKHSKKKYLMVAVAIILSVILISKIDIQSLKKVLKEIEWYTVCIVIFLYNLVVLMDAVKWKLLLKEVKLGNVIKISYEAQFFSTVLPGQLFGEGAKVGKLISSGENLGKAASSVVLNKITAWVGSVCVGGIGILLTDSEAALFIKKWLLLILGLFVFILFLMENRNVYEWFIKLRDKKLLTKSGKIYKFFDKILVIWGEYIDCKMEVTVSVILGIVRQLCCALQLFILVSSFGYDIHFTDMCWITVALDIVLFLPVSFAGIGVRDVSLVGMLSLFSVASEVSVSCSLVMFISLIVSALFGGILYWRDVGGLY